MMSVNALKLFVFLSLLMFGCSSSQPANRSTVAANQPSNAVQELKTTRLHIDGFMKSKSGAI